MSYSATRRKRFTAGVLAGAMALTVMPILGFTGTAGAAHLATADPIGDGNVCEDAPATDPFTDVSDTDPAVDEIRCLANTEPEITKGTTATTYSPNASTQRGQMALFLQRIADLAEANETSEAAVQELPAGDGVTPFTDISDWPAEHQSAIDRLEEAGIAEGVTPTEFRPGTFVSRRQMAKFLVRLQTFLAGEDFAPAVINDCTDCFNDDDGDSGEAELNTLARQGVFIGVAGDGTAHNVEPGEDITRRQMAFVLTRELEVLFEGGVINRLFAEDDSNQTFAVTPAEAAENTVSSSVATSEGARTYTVDVGDATAVDIALFPAENVSTDANGNVTIDPNTQVADNTGVSIETVNGVANVAAGPGAGDAHVDNVGATNGSVTFTIDSVVADSVTPVVFADADNDNVVDLDAATDQPTEDFGVGGVKTWIPAEAATGALAGDEVIQSVNKETDRIVTATATYFYDDTDSFFVDAGETPCSDPTNEVTLTEFEAELSAGDELDAATFYQQNEALDSTFCLEDIAPAAPTLAATGGQGEVDLDITPPAGFDSDDTITLQRATVNAGPDLTCGTVDDVIGAYATVATLTTADDEDTATPAVIDYTDAVAPGCYSYQATATVDGETSAASTAVTAESTADTTAPSMNGATPNDVNDGIGSTDQVVVTFTEAVTILDNSGITVHPAGQPGLVFTVTTSAPANASGTSWLLTLSGSLNDAATDVTYQVDSAAGAYEDGSGNDNVAEDPDTTFAY